VRQSPASKNVNTEAEESTTLGDVTRQPVETDCEDLLRAVVNYRVCELEMAL
jgi:hypothetical protein